VLCTTVVDNDTHTRGQFLNLRVGLGSDFVFVCLFRLNIICDFMLTYLDQLNPMSLAFVVLGLVSSVLSQEIGCEERPPK